MEEWIAYFHQFVYFEVNKNLVAQSSSWICCSSMWSQPWSFKGTWLILLCIKPFTSRWWSVLLNVVIYPRWESNSRSYYTHFNRVTMMYFGEWGSLQSKLRRDVKMHKYQTIFVERKNYTHPYMQDYYPPPSLLLQAIPPSWCHTIASIHNLQFDMWQSIKAQARWFINYENIYTQVHESTTQYCNCITDLDILGENN